MKVTLYHPEHGKKTISAIDFTPAWRSQGWSEQSSQAAKPQPELLTVVDPEPKLFDAAELKARRVAELQGLYEAEGFRPIKDIAEALGISKPEDGWDESFELIAEAEQKRDGN
ncbi:MAG: hypothetical protein AAFN18_11975 [Cyanobacteria bacterium J06554_6]